MILTALGIFAWLLLAWPPVVGLLRAYCLDRFGEAVGARTWRATGAVLVAFFLVFASPWGLSAVADGLAQAFPGAWEAGLASVYRYGFLAAAVGSAFAAGAWLRDRLWAGPEARRAAAIAATVTVLLFAATQYPAINASHCPLFRGGLIFEGFCVVEG